VWKSRESSTRPLVKSKKKQEQLQWQPRVRSTGRARAQNRWRLAKRLTPRSWSRRPGNSAETRSNWAGATLCSRSRWSPLRNRSPSTGSKDAGSKLSKGVPASARPAKPPTFWVLPAQARPRCSTSLPTASRSSTRPLFPAPSPSTITFRSTRRPLLAMVLTLCRMMCYLPTSQ